MNSFQQPNPKEPGGATWHKVADPTTSWLASKTTGWAADSFSGGLTVDFSTVVPVGTRAVMVTVYDTTAVGAIYTRIGSDSAIANTPSASNENSTIVWYSGSGGANRCVIWLSATYTADFAVLFDTQDVYISYPMAYML